MNEIQQPDVVTPNGDGSSASITVENGSAIPKANATVLPDRLTHPEIELEPFSPYNCSSIGPAESKVIPDGVYKDSDKVTKNFCTEVKTSVDAVADVFKQVESYTLAEGARLNIRFITTLDHLAQAIKGKDWGNYIEGVTPLEGCEVRELEGMCIVNLGKIHPARKFDKGEYEILLSEAKEIYDKRENKPQKNHAIPGYRYATFDKNNVSIHEQVIDLLIEFAWSEAEAKTIANSAEVMFGLMICDAHQDEQGHQVPEKVVSLIGIERREMVLTVDGIQVPFTIAEVAEAITAEGYTGNGLYGCANTLMMRSLVEERKAPHILIGEANLHNVGVVKNAFNQGRGCGLMRDDIREKLGITLAALRADFTIREKGDTLPDDRPNCLLPTFQTLQMIKEKYASPMSN
jgi:hypothetical protein